MMPRPFACDGDDCDYTPSGLLWLHGEGCAARDSQVSGDGLDAARDAVAADGYVLVPQQRDRGAA